MSLVFAAITPHPPILIPAIGKDAIKKIEKTRASMEKLEEELYVAKPDVIAIISPHSENMIDAFTINYSNEYETDLRIFGDLTTKLKFKGEMDLPQQIRRLSREDNCKTALISEKILDHGAAVPLFYLTRHLPKTTIMPLGFCDFDAKAHYDFGKLIKEAALKSTKRIALIASADLSHALSTEAPAGFNAAGAEFDANVQNLLAACNTSGLLTMDTDLVKNAAECGLRSIYILLGALRNVKYDYESYSYECPFGVGYLTANFGL